jgi:hypothetical protein
MYRQVAVITWYGGHYRTADADLRCGCRDCCIKMMHAVGERDHHKGEHAKHGHRLPQRVAVLFVLRLG